MSCLENRSGARLALIVALPLLLLAVLIAPLAAMKHFSDDGDEGGTALLPGVPVYEATVTDRQWSDPSWWVQGLDVLDGGDLLIGTGRDSSDPDSVSAVHRLRYGERSASADDVTPGGHFGEGVAVLPHDVFWQLTWTDGSAYLRTETLGLRPVERVDYDGQGWGACYWRGNNSVVTSDGSGTLTIRDTTDLHRLGQVHTGLEGLNELDCPPDAKGDEVWAHVYPTDLLVRISLITGEATGQVDLGEIAGPQRRQAKRHSDDSGAGAPNGLAGVPGTQDQFYLTGKRWDAVYRIELRSRAVRID